MIEYNKTVTLTDLCNTKSVEIFICKERSIEVGMKAYNIVTDEVKECKTIYDAEECNIKKPKIWFEIKNFSSLIE